MLPASINTDAGQWRKHLLLRAFESIWSELPAMHGLKRPIVCVGYHMDVALEKVRAFADSAHGGQLRKYSPDRYIVHPLRVMERCAQAGASRAQLAAALLHDVLEDTAVGEEELLRFLRTVMEDAEALHTLELVIELTDVYTKSDFPKWKRSRRKAAEVERMESISAEAQTIKYADIIDNTGDIVANDSSFAHRYLTECRQLLAAMKEGDGGLRAAAQDAIRSGFEALRAGGK